MTSVILPNALAGLAGGLAGGSPSIPSVLVTVLSVPPMTPITNALPDIPRFIRRSANGPRAWCISRCCIVACRSDGRSSSVRPDWHRWSRCSISTEYADLVLDHRYAARIRLHVCDDSARRGHRQTRGPVYYGARVRVGRIGGVAALQIVTFIGVRADSPITIGARSRCLSLRMRCASV